MAKLKKVEIVGTDLSEYLNDHSDFAFELLVLKTLTEHGFTCEHSGSYDDPATEKPREFDIRATKTIDGFIVRLAIECKNVRSNFPLLVSCVPRRSVEAFHEVVFSHQPEPDEYTVPAMQERARAIRLVGEHSIYRPGDPVGKSSSQVGRDSNDEIAATDSDIYSKWAQAISSAQELTDRACYDAEKGERDAYLSVVMPVMVIPNGKLWIAEFDAHGSKRTPPRQVDRCPYFIDRQYEGGGRIGGFLYRASHLEFVTLSGLVRMIDTLFGQETISTVFPVDQIAKAAKAAARD